MLNHKKFPSIRKVLEDLCGFLIGDIVKASEYLFYNFIPVSLE